MKIMAIGINSLFSSYNQEDKSMAIKYLNDNFLDSMTMFSLLSTQVKIQVIELHKEKFISWARAMEEEGTGGIYQVINGGLE